MIHKAEELLKFLETTQRTLHKIEVDKWDNDIRGEFNAGGLAVDDKLDKRIREAIARVNRIGAEGMLAALAEARLGYGTLQDQAPFAMAQDFIDGQAETIRRQFEAGGITVDDALNARIEAAKVSANRLSAEMSLARFETREASVKEYLPGLQRCAAQIRAQFEAGHVVVDEGLNKRIDEATKPKIMPPLSRMVSGVRSFVRRYRLVS